MTDTKVRRYRGTLETENNGAIIPFEGVQYTDYAALESRALAAERENDESMRAVVRAMAERDAAIRERGAAQAACTEISRMLNNAWAECDAAIALIREARDILNSGVNWDGMDQLVECWLARSWKYAGEADAPKT